MNWKCKLGLHCWHEKGYRHEITSHGGIYRKDKVFMEKECCRCHKQKKDDEFTRTNIILNKVNV